jgi:hypothetical protein
MVYSFIYQKYRFGFLLLLKYKVAKWGVNGKADSTVIGPAVTGLNHAAKSVGFSGLIKMFTYT